MFDSPTFEINHVRGYVEVHIPGFTETVAKRIGSVATQEWLFNVTDSVMNMGVGNERCLLVAIISPTYAQADRLLAVANQCIDDVAQMWSRMGRLWDGSVPNYDGY